jgi:hypothetical protein
MRFELSRMSRTVRRAVAGRVDSPAQGGGLTTAYGGRAERATDAETVGPTERLWAALGPAPDLDGLSQWLILANVRIVWDEAKNLAN